MSSRPGRGRLLVAAALAPLLLAGPVADRARADEPATRQVVVLADGVEDPVKVARDHDGAAPDAVFDEALSGYTATLTPREVAAVEADPRVAFVTADFRFSHDRAARPAPCAWPAAAGPAPGQCLPRWADRVDAERSATRVGDGRGRVAVDVAVIDTGIAQAHPDLDVAGGVDCGSGRPVPVTGPVTDDFGHGTAVAGVLAARDDRAGVVGAAPGARLWSVDVFDERGEAWLSTMLCAVDWVTGTRQDGVRGNDISVANISLTGPGADDGRCGRTSGDALHAAVCASVTAGVGYVAAAGNNGGDLALQVPAAYDEVLTVTAVTDLDGQPGGRAYLDCADTDIRDYGEADDSAASFSDLAVEPRDRLHTIAAPGVCMETTVVGPDGPGYGVVDGTSHAAPVVAGLLAACIQSGPCREGRPVVNRSLLLAAAAAHALARPESGFAGDPLHPAADGRWSGFLAAPVR